MKLSKIFKISIATLCIGIVLTGIGFIMGGANGSFNIINNSSGSKNNNNNEDYKLVEIEESLEEFNKLDLDLSVCTVDIKTGENFGIKIIYPENKVKINYELKDSTLFMTQDEYKNDAVDLFNNYRYEVEVYVPENSMLSSAEIDLNVSSLVMDGLNIETLNIKNEVGDIEIYNSDINYSFIDTDVGSVFLEDSISTELEIKNATGEVSSSGLSVVESSNISCNLGSIELEGSFLGDTSLVANCGSIDLVSTEQQDLYNYNIKSNIGGLTFGDEDYDKGFVKNNNKDNNIDINCDLGDVNVSFE